MQLVENLFVKKILYKICSPVWILTGHVIFKLFYNQIYQLKTTIYLVQIFVFSCLVVLVVVCYVIGCLHNSISVDKSSLEEKTNIC